MKLFSVNGARLARKPSKVQRMINNEPKKAMALTALYTVAASAVFFVQPPEAAAVEPEAAPAPVVAVEVKNDHSNAEELAVGIYSVIRGHNVNELTAIMVGETIMNRVESHIFPNNLHDVLVQPYQFGDLSQGYSWEAIAQCDNADVGKAYEAAEAVLAGASYLPDDVFYVSDTQQGSLVAVLDGLFFGR